MATRLRPTSSLAIFEAYFRGYDQTIPDADTKSYIRFIMNTYPICDYLHFRDRRGRSFSPLQKSRRNRRSYVRTEPLQYGFRAGTIALRNSET